MQGTKNANVAELLTFLDQIKAKAEISLRSVFSKNQVQRLKIIFLGKKSKLSQVLRQLNDVSPEKRFQVGKAANKLRSVLEDLILQKNEKFAKEERLKELGSDVDITLPGRESFIGGKHPLTLVIEKILSVLKLQGFSLIYGPEIEHDYYNFEALNISKNHPARDMQDTFYVDSDVVLRTHTSSVQIRAMLTMKKPFVKIASVGKVYRRDQDITHSPMFHQIEGLFIGEKINFANLKSTLQDFIRGVFSPNLSLRLRPSYFPFTEPSAEVDMSCFSCRVRDDNSTANCKLCKGTGWIEIMGAGMVHPKVLIAGGIDSERYTGFAFGIGIERVALLRYSIPDIRLFFENDLRFLKQF